MKTPLIIGHRGAMGHETENTIASIEKALELGVDMIEIDVFKIASDEIVVFHDDELDRLTNATGNIESYTKQNLDTVVLVGNHQIPTLEEVMSTINRRVPLNIELKGANTAIGVKTIIDACIANKSWDKDDIVISSFNWDELKVMRQIDPSIAIAVLTEYNPLDAIEIADELGAIAINPNFENVTQEICNELHANGFKIYTWTVNEPADLERISAFGVDGIFTNYPERMR